ncbi:3'-5' exonuclease-like [Rhododendron vialii]|uniref:3'-5' exonuclease-like n=1 Tax=Rhododendron vialii TaxID=182163 RepID=UPI00265DEF02|nr:3'-5' exonuclease-like [Rhododendron vialii]
MSISISISIDDYQLPYDTHNLYDVNFYHNKIHTLVTHTPSFVDSWISETLSLHTPAYPFRSPSLLVGLDIEWRPNFASHQDNPAATLQLCVDQRCLIFQLIHSPSIPSSLIDFLANPAHTFVGVGIHKDVEKLMADYGLTVANALDLRVLAAEAYGARELRNAGLVVLARQVLGAEVVKPKRVTMSKWDNVYLYPNQVQYACIDAFVSFEIGRSLNAAGS